MKVCLGFHMSDGKMSSPPGKSSEKEREREREREFFLSHFICMLTTQRSPAIVVVLVTNQVLDIWYQNRSVDGAR